jgi:hypothetical protein
MNSELPRHLPTRLLTKCSAIVFGFLPLIYFFDLCCSATQAFYKFGWDYRPLVAIKLQTFLTFVTYTVSIAVGLISAGLWYRNRIFLFSGGVALIALAGSSIGLLSYVFGILSR